MVKKNANERVFQGELYRIINKILDKNSEISFDKITQEEQVGQKGHSRFADGKLYSKIAKNKIVSFELKDTSWDATDEILVKDAFSKASMNGYPYFVTGNPRQLAIFKTFEEGTSLYDRKLKIYNISSIKRIDDILLPTFENQITATLIEFLKDLSNLIHGVKEIHWDSIDKFFVNKLSAFILEASNATVAPLYEKIKKNSDYKNRLKKYLKSQDIFNVNLSFDYEDVYKISQLSNYLLYLKVIFYSYIQREVPKLELKPLEIPLDTKQLNKVLRNNFDKVLEWDYESIFTKTVLDEIIFEEAFLPVLKKQVEELNQLNFKELKADVIGSIYNTLLDNQEQHDRGQHFTNIDEVDIVNAFCINAKTQTVIDTGCGAGTFLVRAYKFIQFFNPKKTHEQILELIWGVEISTFPVFLSTMNLCLLNVKSIDNYPIIINDDFCNVNGKKYYSLKFKHENKFLKVRNLQNREAEVKMPEFDACIGNPPYIRQELIENKEAWLKNTKTEWGINKINKQSDLYVHYLMHTASLLKEGKRLGYVVSSSWLDVGFGRDLQLFLLQHFKIIAIIEHQNTRSFSTASINTIILIIEKCSNENERDENKIKFVRINESYQKIIGRSDDANRIENSINFVKKIETATKSTKIDDFQIIGKNQKELFEESIVDGKYENGHWGAKYLRAPEIFNKILITGNGKLIKASKFIDVKYGIKSGSNDFFFLEDDTDKIKDLSDEDFKMYFGFSKENNHINFEKNGWYFSNLTNRHYLIEKRYIKHLFKSQKEANKLDVDLNNLKNGVIICDEQKSKLIKFKNNILKYIDDAEAQDVHKKPTCLARKPWYNLSNSAVVGDFIFPSKIGERFRLIDNRKSQILCDKVNYAIVVKEEYKELSDIIFLILNSQLFRYFVDLFARQMVVKVSDVDVNIVENTLIVNPNLLLPYKKELNEIYNSIKSREQEVISKEILMPDKKKLDSILFNVLGLKNEDVDELYKVALNYINDRKIKSESLTTAKSKQNLNYADTFKLITDRFGDISNYNELLNGVETRKIKIENWTAKYPKDLFSENIFGIYHINFVQGNKSKDLSFDSLEQLRLFKFLHQTLDIKAQTISIPTKKEECIEILEILQSDFKGNIDLIKNLIKTYRSKADFISIYRDLILNKK